jgi:hypothetical protein
MVLVFSAWAQAPKDPAKEPAKPAAQESAKPAPAKEAAKEAAKPAGDTPKQAAVRGKPRRWNEDARHCLERASNTEIIKCAEEYL